MGWTRAILVAVVAAVCLTFAGPVAAQDEPDPPAVTVIGSGDEAAPTTEIVRDDDTSATVQRIRRELVAVAIVVVIGLAVYIWHTNPSRRLRVAAARVERPPADIDDD